MATALIVVGVAARVTLLTGIPAAAFDRHVCLELAAAIIAAPLFTALAIVTRSLAAASAERSAHAVEQRDQFLLEVAHELRSPLATMRLLTDEFSFSERDSREVADRLRSRIDGMEAVLTSLLVRARAQAGLEEIELVPVQLDQVVEVSIDDLALAYPELKKMVSFQAEEAIVMGNAALITQAVRNLVLNAQRYGAPPIALSVLKSGALRVDDAGTGIPAAHRGAVLNRGVGTGRGTGTGLAIVAWVAEVHHARLQLRDAPAGGLRVELAFRAA